MLIVVVVVVVVVIIIIIIITIIIIIMYLKHSAMRQSFYIIKTYKIYIFTEKFVTLYRNNYN